MHDLTLQSIGSSVRDRLRAVTPKPRRVDDIVSGKVTDEALFARVAAAGDQTAYGELMTRYRSRLTAMARTLLKGSPAAADTEDVVQDTFVAAYTRARTFRTGSLFRPWLYRIVINSCLDRLRRNRWVADSPDLGQTLSSPGDDPLIETLSRERWLRIESAVQALPVAWRMVFVLRHLESMSYAEISAAVELPEGTVKTYLFRARARLRDHLKDLVDS